MPTCEQKDLQPLAPKSTPSGSRNGRGLSLVHDAALHFFLFVQRNSSEHRSYAGVVGQGKIKLPWVPDERLIVSLDIFTAVEHTDAHALSLRTRPCENWYCARAAKTSFFPSAASQRTLLRCIHASGHRKLVMHMYLDLPKASM